MSTIQVPIRDEILQSLRTLMAGQDTTLELFFAEEAENLLRHLKAPIHPEVIKASGHVRVDEEDRAAYYDYMAKKHA